MNALRSSLSASILGSFLALLSVSTTLESYRALLRECEIEYLWRMDASCPENEQQYFVPCVTYTFLKIEDYETALFVATFAGTMLLTVQGDDAETEMLYSLLSDLGYSYPEAVSLV